MSITRHPLIGSLELCYGYCSFRYKHKLFVYAGCTEDLSYEYYLPADEIYELNLFTGIWNKRIIKQNSALPNTRAYSVMVPCNDTAFLFCGFDTKEHRMCDFRGLDLNTFEFRVLPSPPVSERDKLEGWVYGDDVYFFGGYGPVSNNYKEGGSNFTIDRDPESYWYAWNNELVAYSTKENKWFNPSVRGSPPSGRAAYGLAQFGHRIYFVCGRRVDRRCREVHMLDMRGGEWSGEIKPSGGGPAPEGRSFLVCCPVGPRNIYVQGGINRDSTALSDMWLFNIETHTWSEIMPQSAIPARVACRGHLGMDDSTIVVVSGKKLDTGAQLNIPAEELGNNDYMVLQMEPTSLRLSCLRRLYVMLGNETVDWNVLDLLPVHIQIELIQLIM